MGRKADVAGLWRAGQVGSGNNMMTDGRTIWSYALVIGVTEEGRKVAFDYRGPNSYSVTTSRHVGFAAEVADEIRPPPQGG